jgi:hypothetical protein
MTFLNRPRRPRMPVPSQRRCRPQVELLAERLVPSFTPAGNVAVGVGPISVAVADFNGDGKQDLAVANFTGNTVSIRLGDGHGGFTPVEAAGAGIQPSSVAVGDFNGDGKQDLAVANLGSPPFQTGSVSIRLGDGHGGFTPVADVAVGGAPRSVAVADFDGDGKLDLATANLASDSVSIRLGSGTGEFITIGQDVGVGDGPDSVAVGDFNRDGELDLAVSNFNSGSVSIRLGDGKGGFSGTTNLPVGKEPGSVAVADFNGDGKLDLAVANSVSSTVGPRLGDGHGGFNASSDVAVGPGPVAVAVADFNGDGKQDLATANQLSDSVSIRLGDGHGGFTIVPDVAVGDRPSSVAVADFDGDGKLDLAVANLSSNTVSILLNTVAGPARPPAPAQLVAVAFRRKGVSRVRVRDAATGAVRAVLTPFQGFGGRLRLQLVDVTGDGALDLVVQAVVHGKRRKKVYDAVTLALLPPNRAYPFTPTSSDRSPQEPQP